MSIVEKLKNLLAPEVDNDFEENEPKKEIYEEIKDLPKPEKDEYKFEETFNFPVTFDEEDLFDDFEVEEEQKPKIKEQKREKTPDYLMQREKPVAPLTKKPFKPSPIISPVYGIIDPESDVVKPITQSKLSMEENDHQVSFDSIRQKAYGSIEDEIENVINDGTDIFFDLEEKEEDDDNIVAEFVEEQNDISEITIEEAEESYEYRGVATDTKRKPKAEELMDLVDEMYNQEDEEEV